MLAQGSAVKAFNVVDVPVASGTIQNLQEDAKQSKLGESISNLSQITERYEERPGCESKETEGKGASDINSEKQVAFKPTDPRLLARLLGFPEFTETKEEHHLNKNVTQETDGNRVPEDEDDNQISESGQDSESRESRELKPVEIQQTSSPQKLPAWRKVAQIDSKESQSRSPMKVKPSRVPKGPNSSANFSSRETRLQDVLKLGLTVAWYPDSVQNVLASSPDADASKKQISNNDLDDANNTSPENTLPSASDVTTSLSAHKTILEDTDLKNAPAQSQEATRMATNSVTSELEISKGSSTAEFSKRIESETKDPVEPSVAVAVGDSSEQNPSSETSSEFDFLGLTSSQEILKDSSLIENAATPSLKEWSKADGGEDLRDIDQISAERSSHCDNASDIADILGLEPQTDIPTNMNASVSELKASSPKVDDMHQTAPTEKSANSEDPSQFYAQFLETDLSLPTEGEETSIRSTAIGQEQKSVSQIEMTEDLDKSDTDEDIDDLLGLETQSDAVEKKSVADLNRAPVIKSTIQAEIQNSGDDSKVNEGSSRLDTQFLFESDAELHTPEDTRANSSSSSLATGQETKLVNQTKESEIFPETDDTDNTVTDFLGLETPSDGLGDFASELQNVAAVENLPQSGETFTVNDEPSGIDTQFLFETEPTLSTSENREKSQSPSATGHRLEETELSSESDEAIEDFLGLETTSEQSPVKEDPSNIDTSNIDTQFLFEEECTRPEVEGRGTVNDASAASQDLNSSIGLPRIDADSDDESESLTFLGEVFESEAVKSGLTQNDGEVGEEITELSFLGLSEGDHRQCNTNNLISPELPISLLWFLS